MSSNKSFRRKRGKDSSSTISSADRRKSVISKFQAKRIFRRRNELKIIVGEEDVTPRVLNFISDYNVLPSIKDNRKSLSQLDILKSDFPGNGMFSTLASSTFNLQTQLQSITISSIYTSQATRSSIVKLNDDYSETIWCQESEEELEDKISIAPEKIEMIPNRLNLMLTETPVAYLFELPSTSELKDSVEGNEIQKANDNYDYLTIGKGRNRKTVHEEIQTNQTVQRNSSTQAEKGKRKNNQCFASAWDMLDTYNGCSEVEQVTHSKTHATEIPTERELEQQFIKLLRNPKFQFGLIVIERILANNNYNTQQKRFRGMIEQDPFRPDIAFKYDIELLWTFKTIKTEGHPVTSMHWNPKNKDILAVGYGKFFYIEQKQGFVYCWNIKNPTQPEREFYYPKPVTSVAFSTFTANILAVGFYDGTVSILDITDRTVQVVATTRRNFSPAHDPIWQVDWLAPDDYHPNEEYLVCIGQNGKMHRLIRGKSADLVSQPMMRTLPIEGKLRGVYQPRHCPASDIPLTKCAAAFVITKHPADKNMFFIGTDEGTLHKCSRHFVNQHIYMFLAHYGPVYSCEFSPFSHKLFLTSGADCCTNIWTETVPKPLLSLSQKMEPVEDAAWSPANSTIIANIVGTEIVIWDLQRRAYLPVSVHKSPTNSRNTILQFTHTGRNLIVGDIDGNVHIFALVDMPFPPFYQTEMLYQVLKKALVAEHDIADKIDALAK